MSVDAEARRGLQAGSRDREAGSSGNWADYDQHARTRPRDDVWGQVRRTVAGRPVAPEQIDMIVASVVRGLALDESDTLLDLACGNGALTERLQPICQASLGVDLSPYLIEIARERFAGPAHRFETGEAAAWAETAPGSARFSKVLCYGSLSYLTDDQVARLFAALSRRFNRAERVLLGNLPDPQRARAFFGERPIPDLREPRSDLGVWRSAAELAERAGPDWTAEVCLMPDGFFAAHYRFDLLLVRR